MKVVDYYWEHPLLKEYLKRVPEGSYLFKQGEPGKSLFILIKGFIELTAVREKREHVVSLVEAGQFLGEQSLMRIGPYQRAFSARAKTNLTVLELGTAELETIQKSSPQLMTEILRGIFNVASERLQKANRLISFLRPAGNAERMVNLILYFSESTGQETPEGKEVLITKENIRYYIDMGEYEVEECLKELQKRKLIIHRANDFYLIRDEKALRAYIPALADSLPTIQVI